MVPVEREELPPDEVFFDDELFDELLDEVERLPEDFEREEPLRDELLRDEPDDVRFFVDDPVLLRPELLFPDCDAIRSS